MLEPHGANRAMARNHAWLCCKAGLYSNKRVCLAQADFLKKVHVKLCGRKAKSFLEVGYVLPLTHIAFVG